MTIPEAIALINNTFSGLVNNGVGFLTEDMPKNPSFNPSSPYDEKNYYFNRANAIGLMLMKVGKYLLAEIYFREMLKCIENYEQRNNKKFNKGMVYGNLGISKIAQGELDGGIAFLMAGFKEDAPITGDHEHQFLKSPLYQQFERNIHGYIITKRKNYVAGSVGSDYGEVFMNSFDVDNRLYLMVIVSNLITNLEVFNSGNDNKYTKGRILSTLSDLCVFIEDAIKRKLSITTERITLKPLLRDRAFSSEAWKANLFSNWDNLTSASNIQDLDANLKAIFVLGNRDVERFLVLGALRNFAGHNFDVNGPFLFSKIEAILINIIEVIFYLKDNGKL